MQLYGYVECNDEDDNLKSFTLILSDENSENRVALDTVGISNDESCQGYRFPSPYIQRAAIYADDNRVYGVRFQSLNDFTDFGSLTGNAVLNQFDIDQRLIGFYGSVNGAVITSLGFLMHDPECDAQTEVQGGTVIENNFVEEGEILS